MMKDGKALQSATSHYFGDKFSKAYNVTFTGRDNTLQYPYGTSWGSTTRLIGAVIMTHGDDNGLILPPAIAPIQVVVIPVAQHKEGVLDAAYELESRLKALNLRVKTDDSDQSNGWKYAEYEMKGVPLRVEIGPKDMEKGQCVIARRDTGEKYFVPLEQLEEKVQSLLTEVHDNLYNAAKERLEANTFAFDKVEDVKAAMEKHTCFAKTMWCGNEACEIAMKELAGVSSRCMPFDQENLGETCPVCGKPAKKMVVWGVAY
jgi:prolyl-tRNA synthetase